MVAATPLENLTMLIKTRNIDDPRREFLLGALATGLLAATPAFPGVFGDVPKRLAPGRSIYLLRGEVKVNGDTATKETVINAGALVETGPASKVVFVVGADAFIMRANSQLQLTAYKTAQATTEATINKPTVLDTLRLVTGGLLAVFGRGNKRIETRVATIGIRGTGVYIEAEPERTYFCTCYGTTTVSPIADPNTTETIVSVHHDAPRYILAKPTSGKLIDAAPIKNHDDEELALVETLVGREPPFAASGSYTRPRKRRY